MYKCGSNHTNADFYLHLPVSHLNSLQVATGNTLGETQINDPQLQPVISALTKAKYLSTTIMGLHRCFLSIDGILYRWYTCSTTLISHIQFVFSSLLRDTVLNHLHDSSGHFGVKCTTDLVRTQFYWPRFKSRSVRLIWIISVEQYLSLIAPSRIASRMK